MDNGYWSMMLRRTGKFGWYCWRLLRGTRSRTSLTPSADIMTRPTIASFGVRAALLVLLILVAASSTAAAQPAAPLRLGVVGLTHSHVHGLLGRKPLGDVVIVGIVEKNRDLARRFT